MHGTTSGLMKPHDFILRPSNNGARGIGRTRSSLLTLQEDHSGRYFGVFSCCLAPPGSSLVESGRLLHPINMFSYIVYANKFPGICQAFCCFKYF